MRRLGVEAIFQLCQRDDEHEALDESYCSTLPFESYTDKASLSFADFLGQKDTYALKVRGNSMIEDHILNGDYVVIEPTQVANPGEIVVALVGNDEATLKRFYREPAGKVRLQPANSEMAPIIVSAADVQIQGRVVGVLRKY